MNTEQLKAFVILAESGSIRKASAHLYMTPPAVKQALDRLEGETGFALFERSNTGLILTEAGAVFLDYANRLLSLVDEGLAEARSRILPAHATLDAPYFGGYSVYSTVFPEALGAFRRACPEVLLQYRKVKTMADGQFDVVNLTLGDYSGPATAHLLERLPLCCEVSRSNPLSTREFIRLEDLDPYELVAPVRYLADLMDETTRDYLSRRKTQDASRLAQNGTAWDSNHFAWCDATGGVMLQIGRWPRRGPMTEFVPLKGSHLQYNIYTHTEPSAAVQRYVSFILDYYAAHNSPA